MRFKTHNFELVRRFSSIIEFHITFFTVTSSTRLNDASRFASRHDCFWIIEMSEKRFLVKYIARCLTRRMKRLLILWDKSWNDMRYCFIDDYNNIDLVDSMNESMKASNSNTFLFHCSRTVQCYCLDFELSESWLCCNILIFSIWSRLIW